MLYSPYSEQMLRVSIFKPCLLYTSLFPRMYSSAHTQQYHAWQDIKGYDVPYDKCGNMIMVNMPTQWELSLIHIS